MQSGLISIEGFNSRGSRIRNAGFELKPDPNVLLKLAAELQAIANAELELESLEKSDSEKILSNITKAGYSIEECLESKGSFYFYVPSEDYASPNFQNEKDAIKAAHADLQMSPELRHQNRV